MGININFFCSTHLIMSFAIFSGFELKKDGIFKSFVIFVFTKPRDTEITVILEKESLCLKPDKKTVKALFAAP